MFNNVTIDELNKLLIWKLNHSLLDSLYSWSLDPMFGM